MLNVPQALYLKGQHKCPTTFFLHKLHTILHGSLIDHNYNRALPCPLSLQQL